MERRTDFIKRVLICNGIADLFSAALLIFFPVSGLIILGYAAFEPQGAFMAGGWGVSTLALGATRIWSSFRRQYHPVMIILGLIEGLSLSVYSLCHVVFTRTTLLQALLPLLIGTIFGFLYLLAAVWERRP